MKGMQQTLVNRLTDIARLELALGHTFARPQLLIQALTHRSQAYELAMETTGKPDDGERADNERLEFLGDAVLGVVVAEAIFQSHSDWQEGDLTRVRAQLVSRRHMAEVAQTIGLGEHLRLGKGEERSGGRKKAAILANAMEAVLAAMYLDAGLKPLRDDVPNPLDSLEPVRRFAQRYILGPAADDLAQELLSGAALGDHKSALQEQLQSSHAGVPVYCVESESGPDHRKRFEIAVRLRASGGELGEALATGTGSTKKKAEQEAARRALESRAWRRESDATGWPDSRNPSLQRAHEPVQEPAEV
jgi:ribonuclease-3